MVLVKYIIKALFVRIMLTSHSLLSVWRVVDVTQFRYYWLLLVSNIFVVIETYVRLKKKKGQEDKCVPVMESVVKSLFVRLLFFIHASLAIWLLSSRLGQEDYLSLIVLTLPLLVDTGVTVWLGKDRYYAGFLDVPTFWRGTSIAMVTSAIGVNVHFRALAVRLTFMVHTLLAYWRLTLMLRNIKYWFMLLLVAPQFVEYLLTAIFRKGYEGKWFSPCFFFYLLSTVPAIWLLELDRLARYTDIYENANSTHVDSESLSAIQGVSLPITLSPSLWMSVIEQSFLFLIIIGRWILPRGELTRDKLSQLLFVYIGMASDIMDLFVLFEEPEVRKDKIYTYVILVLWSVSLLQFSIVMTATRSPKKPRTALIRLEEGSEIDDKKGGCCTNCCSCMNTEIWSLFISFLMQDGPFLTCRLYGLIRYNLITYSIIFYTCKNIFVVLLLLYRVFVLCCTDHTSEPERATQRAVKKVSVIRSMSRSHGRVATVEEDYANNDRRPQIHDPLPKRAAQSRTTTGASPKHSPMKVVDLD